MQFSNIFKSLLVACTILVPSIAAGPIVEAREECCDPDFFYPCMMSQVAACPPETINLCSGQAEGDCLALCVGKPGATPDLC